MAERKLEVITFKVDEKLAGLLKQIPNRSEFIRNSIFSAMESVCPLCNGTGILTEEQKKHWREFTANHAVEECDGCRAKHLVCHA